MGEREEEQDRVGRELTTMYGVDCMGGPCV